MAVSALFVTSLKLSVPVLFVGVFVVLFIALFMLVVLVVLVIMLVVLVVVVLLIVAFVLLLLVVFVVLGVEMVQANETSSINIPIPSEVVPISLNLMVLVPLMPVRVRV